MKVYAASEVNEDDDLKTPTVEELAFPGHKAVRPFIHLSCTPLPPPPPVSRKCVLLQIPVNVGAKLQHNPPLQMMSTSTDGDGGSSTSSSASLGSSEQSSGYGSQNAIVKPFNRDGNLEAARSTSAAARGAVKSLQKSEEQPGE